MKQLLLPCLLCVFLTACIHNNKNTPSGDGPATTAVAADKLFVNPPFAGTLNVAPGIYTVEPSAQRTIKLGNGGSIEIPAGAFLHKDGRPVTEKVEIRYREFQTPGEIIASGIPMKAIGPDGVEGRMQSAGMFEIEGSVRGENVLIAPDKKITVNLCSHAPGKFDTWFFDPEAGNWVDTGDSDVNTPMTKTVRPELSDTAIPAAKPPVKPLLLDRTKPKLNFDVNYARFPELQAMKGMVLQYIGNDAGKDPANNNWIFNHKWEDIKLEPAQNQGQYLLTLSSDEKTYSIPVAPCLGGQDYAIALRDYETKLADFRRSVRSRVEQDAYVALQGNFLRSMGIGKFGIYNYDIFWKQPENVHILANFDFDGITIPAILQNQVSVYLISKGGNMVVGFDKQAWHMFSFNPGEPDNKLLAILPGGKIALITEPAFRDLIPGLKGLAGQNYTFKMKVLDQTIATTKDLDKALLTAL